MQGLPESSVDGRSLLYQLIMVQAMCEKRSDFSQVPPLVNNHPMLQESALIDAQAARSLYEKLLVHYGVVQGDDEDMEEHSEDDQVKQESAQEQELDKETLQRDTESVDLKADMNSSTKADGDSGSNAKTKSSEDQLQPEPIEEPSEPETSVPASGSQPKNLVSSVAKQETALSSTTGDKIANLDKLVGMLYMKYTHELLQTIEEDKKEFTKVFSSIAS